MPESVHHATDPCAARGRAARTLRGVARRSTALLAGGALLLALVPRVLAGVASPFTVSFPVPSPIVIGGPGAHEVVARGRGVTGKAVAVSAVAVSAVVVVGLPDSATDGASASREREQADTNDTRRWLLVLGGSLVTIVALRRRLEESPTTAR